MPLKDVLVQLLSPVLVTLAEAYKKPYLSPHTVRASLEIVKTVLKLVLQGRELQGPHQNGGMLGMAQLLGGNLLESGNKIFVSAIDQFPQIGS